MTRKSASNRINVTFKPDNVTTTVAEKTNLLTAAIDAGVHINASCGGAGTCGTCKVLVENGSVFSKRTTMVSEEEYARGIRQACQSRVLSNLVAHVPLESRLETGILEREMGGGAEVQAVLAGGWRYHPPLTKLLVKLTPPAIKDKSSDLSRLMRGLRQLYGQDSISVDLAVVRKLAAVIREGEWTVTASLLRDDEATFRLINIEPGDTRSVLYGLAFDIGTTGVRGQLLDLCRGDVLAKGLEYNKQISYGADVISRIACCSKSGGLKKLQKAVTVTINSIISDMLAEAGIEADDVGHMVVAGNTTMIQLLLALDPKYLRLAPYVPTVSSAPQVAAAALGIDLPPHVYVYTVPSVASYVGGDIVAGVVGTGIHQSEQLTLYIDIGTNGEIVIGNADWMVTASASAGPAFEGGGIKHGIIATDGAIEDFSIDPASLEPEVHTIGDSSPKGICGAGLINIVAALLLAGIINQKGKFHGPRTDKRVRKGTDGHEYLVASAAETAIGQDIVLTEMDIDNLIRAKAAMYAGCQTLIQSVGASCADVERVVIAGTFGSHIDIESAVTIGLLPDLPRERFSFIGNGSLLGARLTAFSGDILDEGKRVAAMMTNLELSQNSQFMHDYVGALFLPHTHIDQFPSVKESLKRSKQGANV
jgi:uncharacterized 2Fe-2S/4Fe-4S cluster protein (DUF4445 family)